MLDFRMDTFLMLCETMNYTKAAKQLSITQPAVTQHIRYLEKKYNCKLFSYSGKTLSLTKKGEMLASYTKSMRYNSQKIEQEMKRTEDESRHLHIGATKTIGECIMAPLIANYLLKKDHNVTLTVDNTQVLLNLLDLGALDFALIEGTFDKEKYGSSLYKREAFRGFCKSSHPFAGKQVSFADLIGERLFIREEGSGTRAVFEQTLLENNYSLNSFKNVSIINNFAAIKSLVLCGAGISFLYEEAFLEEIKKESVATFYLGGEDIFREFNYVYLKENLFLGNYHDFFIV